MCDDCWQFSSSHRHETSNRTNDVKSMKNETTNTVLVCRSLQGNVSSLCDVFSKFSESRCNVFTLGVNDTTRDDIRNHLQVAPSHLFRFVQESVFLELRENEFNRFIQLKQFRNLQKCSIWHDDENKNTHHLKMQYRSMGAMLHSNASSGTTTTTGTKGRNVRSVGGRSSTYKPKASFATLEEWEKSSAWMDLERVPADLVTRAMMMAESVTRVRPGHHVRATVSPRIP